MCQAAKSEGRHEETRLAFQRNNLIRLACLASGPAVQGIRLVGLRLGTHHTDRIALRRAWNKGIRQVSSIAWSTAKQRNFEVDGEDVYDFDRQHDPLEAAVVRLGAWHYSEQLANNVCDFCRRLQLMSAHAQLVAQFVASEPALLETNKSQNNLSIHLWATLENARFAAHIDFRERNRSPKWDSWLEEG